MISFQAIVMPGTEFMLAELDCMRPLPIGFARQVAVVPITFEAENVTAAIIQDRNRLDPVAIASIAADIDPKQDAFEITVFHVEQARI